MFQINQVNKPHIFDAYNHVLTQFTSLKSINSFTNFSQIQCHELILICNISFDCIDKLTEVSGFIERKLNDQNLNQITLAQLTKLENLHEKLNEEIYSFVNITNDMKLFIQNTATGNINQEVINYIIFDLINKYKQIILKIFTLIKRIIVYVELLKPKLN
jgi:hypothetical protein